MNSSPTLAAVPGDEFHILDVLPVVWPRRLAWLEEAAKDPQTVIDGTLSVRAIASRRATSASPLSRTRPTPNGARNELNSISSTSATSLMLLMLILKCTSD